MKKKLLILFLALCALCLFACGGGGLPDGEFKISGTFRTGHETAKAMDGDVSTGWICRKKANETTFQELKIDFGRSTSFQTVRLDDTFAEGYTNKPPEFLQAPAIYNRGDVSSLQRGTTPANVINGSADGQSWISSAIPTEDAPQWIYLSLQEPVDALKLELNNQMNNSIPRHFALYTSETALASGASVSDPSNYALLCEMTENEENVVTIEPEAETRITDVLLVIYSQVNEGEPCEASLDELLFYGSAEGYTETHQPVHFLMMYSQDDISYEVFLEVNGNADTVYETTLDRMITCRFVKYLIFEENNNNYPSIGELSFT